MVGYHQIRLMVLAQLQAKLLCLFHVKLSRDVEILLLCFVFAVIHAVTIDVSVLCSCRELYLFVIQRSPVNHALFDGVRVRMVTVILCPLSVAATNIYRAQQQTTP